MNLRNSNSSCSMARMHEVQLNRSEGTSKKNSNHPIDFPVSHFLTFPDLGYIWFLLDGASKDRL